MHSAQTVRSWRYRRDELEEELEVIVFDVGVDELLAVPIHDADIHLAGVEVDSAVELCGGGVILHSDHSLWGRKTPGYTFGYAESAGDTLRPAIYAIKKTTGL